MDIPFGLLPNVPFLLLAALMPLVFRGAGGRAPELRVWVGALGWTALGMGGFLLCFYAAMVRYVADFVPALALLAAGGAMGWLAWAEERGGRWRRWFARGTIGALAVVSVTLVAWFSFRAYDRVRQFNPSLYAAVARLANAPVHWLEGRAGAPAGALTLDVELPAKREPGRVEELVATGRPGQTDRVLLLYGEGEEAWLAFEHGGGPLRRSGPLRLPAGHRARLHLSFGGLYPVETHPIYRGWRPEHRAALLRRVRIELEGETVVAVYQRSYDAEAESLRVAAPADEQTFSGRVLGVAREPWSAMLAMAAQEAEAQQREPRIVADPEGTLHLRVRFPGGRAGRREPLVVSGETGRGDVLAVEYLEAGRVRFLLDHWGRRPYLSEPVAIEPGREYRLTVQHPYYAPAHARGLAAGASPLRVALDGQTVWECEPPLYPVEPEDIFVGKNPLGGSGAEESFTGRIEAAR